MQFGQPRYTSLHSQTIYSYPGYFGHLLTARNNNIIMVSNFKSKSLFYSLYWNYYFSWQWWAHKLPCLFRRDAPDDFYKVKLFERLKRCGNLSDISAIISYKPLALLLKIRGSFHNSAFDIELCLDKKKWKKPFKIKFLSATTSTFID